MLDGMLTKAGAGLATANNTLAEASESVRRGTSLTLVLRVVYLKGFLQGARHETEGVLRRLSGGKA